LGRSYKWLGWKREREVYKITEKHFYKLLEVVQNIHEFLSVYRNREETYRDIFQTIFDLEREADNIKEEIIKELSRGPFHPMDREDIMRLIMTADDIASYGKAATRKLMYVDPKDVPTNILEGLMKLGEMCLKEMSHLNKALEMLMKDSEKTMEETNKVERMEEAVDEYREELISEILKWADETRFVSRWLMVKEATENLEMMSDSMENTADIIRGLTISF
jgi:hypothetical protein